MRRSTLQKFNLTALEMIRRPPSLTVTDYSLRRNPAEIRRALIGVPEAVR